MINVKHNRQYILRKLKMTDLEYCENVERGGYVWLERYFSHVPEVIFHSSHSTYWWKWWVNEWNIRDEHFVKLNRFYEWQFDVERLIYKDVHAIETIHIIPNKWVRQEVHNLIKQHEQQLQQLNICK